MNIPDLENVLSAISPSFCMAKWHRTNLRLYNGTAYSCHHCIPRKINIEKLKDDPSALTNTDEVQEFRQQMLDGERPSECSYCWKKEDEGLVSDRIIKSNGLINNLNVDPNETIKSLQAFPKILDVAFDNTCNFKCSYCGPENSSMWVDEIAKHGPYPTEYKKKSIESVKQDIIPNKEDNPYIEAFWKWWDLGLGENLQRLTITGGEPLLSKQTWKVLDRVISQNLNIIININTNLCVPDALFNRLTQKIKQMPVKYVEVSTSIESLDKQAEYSRFGLDYEKWKKNVHSILADPKVKLHINLTNNALSYMHMVETLQFTALLKIKYGMNRIRVSSNDVQYPSYLDIRVLPTQLRKQAYYSLEKFITKNKSLYTDVELLQINRTNEFALTDMHDQERNENDFKKFILEYDKRRNTDYKLVFPYLIPFIEKDKSLVPWCVDPFINFAHTADGYYRPCCIGTADRSVGSCTKDMSPLEYFTGDEMQTLRREMLTGSLSEYNKNLCRQCVENDKNNVTSRRIKQNNRWLNDPKVVKVLDQYKDPTYVAQPKDLQYVNFKILGNLCNLKCLMCGPSASSKIGAEWKKHDIYGGANLDKIERLPYDDSNQDAYMKDLDTIISNIEQFSMVGGEAFINPNFDTIWNTLANNKNAKNLNLLIITNGTVIPQKVLDNAGKFKQLRLLFSIDGVGDRGSYVRSGLNWQLFDTNVKRALQSDAKCAFTVATSMLNIGYLDDIYDYLKELNISDAHIYWDAIVTEPTNLRAYNLPQEIKQEYLTKLKRHRIFHKNVEKFNTAIEILETITSDHKQFLSGIEFLKKTDTIRKTNLLDHFPEFTKYYL